MLGHIDTQSTQTFYPWLSLNDFLGTFAHCKFSTDTPSFINQYCTLETKAYREESTSIQSLGLFCKDVVWNAYIEHAQRKGGNQQNRTEQNQTMLMQRYVYSLLRCASKHYWQSQRSSNIISLFIELFYVHRHITSSY